jgi:hypothetical protein
VRYSPIGKVPLSVAEFRYHEICSALEGRRLDAALIPSVILWPHAAALPVYRERLVAALPIEHRLSARSALDWASLVDEII